MDIPSALREIAMLTVQTDVDDQVALSSKPSNSDPFSDASLRVYSRCQVQTLLGLNNYGLSDLGLAAISNVHCSPSLYLHLVQVTSTSHCEQIH